MKKIFIVILLSAAVLPFVSCSKDQDDTVNEPKLIIKFKFDPTQARLNNIGQPSTVAAGNAAQSPTQHNGLQ